MFPRDSLNFESIRPNVHVNLRVKGLGFGHSTWDRLV
ncbi:hypothetical protein SDC9_08650 [bioreactor metagenome]|uniref:Uncharacterized protein n=1 Tax=bioreactor metagenome TaxID=1076179 RepID=A0A644T876_9ZZZZ